jgi:predicted homoserine dehydrogenase-like protein
VTAEGERITELSERLSTLSRAVLELTVVVETLAEIVAASNLAAARDMLTGDELDDVGTEMKVHLVSVRDAVQQASRPRR